MIKLQRNPRRPQVGLSQRNPIGVLCLSIACVFMPGLVEGQDLIQTAAETTITISRGSTALLTRPDSITRADINDPDIADVSIHPSLPRQVLIYARGIGSTSLIIWSRTGPARIYTIVVSADIAALQRQIDDLFPGAGLSVTSTGTSVVLSGEVRDDAIVQKAIELANTQGIPVVNNVVSPAPDQILLHVEFAEVSKSAIREVGGDLIRILNPRNLGDAFGADDQMEIEAVSEGFVTLMIEGDGAGLDAVIRALKNTGEFRSLAQPNLVTREGQSASFLAGGEFPFPSVQGGAGNAVTIQWRDFGIKLDFTPTITNSGNIRLQVAPEVSSLDFANGLTYEGFNIPSLLTRKVQTDVELRPGQTLAIGGLLDSRIAADVDKIPILGDIPILGFFFRSEAARQERSELLVLVTPHILDPDNLPAPSLPTGEAEDWDWDASIRSWMEARSGAALTRSGGSGGSGGL